MYMPDKQQQSEFNEAISFLYRINSIFYSILISKMERDMDGWGTGLVNLYSELVNDMKGKQEEYLQELQSIIDEVNKQNRRINVTGNYSVPPNLYWKLLQFESKLRSVYDKAGYQTRRKDDAMRALK